VAEVYRDALERGEAPTKAIQEKFPASKSAAAKWVAKCRALGLLPPTTRGRSVIKKGDSK
jgi:transposase